MGKEGVISLGKATILIFDPRGYGMQSTAGDSGPNTNAGALSDLLAHAHDMTMGEFVVEVQDAGGDPEQMLRLVLQGLRER